MIAITHTPEAGTILEGSTKGDGTNHIFNSGGRHWRWSRNLGAWYIPRSRDTAAHIALITQTAEQLRAVGHDVVVAIKGGHRSTIDVESDRAERQQDRAQALTAKAERRTAAAHTAHDHARQLADQVPFGQPILVGHHSEGRMRRHAQRIHAAMDATVKAATLAEQTQRRAAVAATGTAAKYHPVTVANRIGTLTAERNRITRHLDGHTRTVAVMNDGTRHVETTPAATGTYRGQLTERLAVITDQQTYWQRIREQQITDGEVTGHGPATINKGDAVQIRGRWYEVVRVNKKTVTVPAASARGPKPPRTTRSPATDVRLTSCSPRRAPHQRRARRHDLPGQCRRPRACLHPRTENHRKGHHHHAGECGAAGIPRLLQALTDPAGRPFTPRTHKDCPGNGGHLIADTYLPCCLEPNIHEHPARA